MGQRSDDKWFEPEQAMGRWVMGQWVKWVTFLDGSHGSWVSAF